MHVLATLKALELLAFIHVYVLKISRSESYLVLCSKEGETGTDIGLTRVTHFLMLSIGSSKQFYKSLRIHGNPLISWLLILGI